MTYPETEHQRERRERAENKAERLHRRADAQMDAARAETEHIPLGQPILVGHHSAPRHRRALERQDRKMAQAVDTHRAAQEASAAAHGAGRSISSDDPEAVPALTAQLEELEAKRALWKRINAAFRRGGWDAVERVEGATPEVIARGKRNLELCPWDKAPFGLTNIGANIRRVAKRIAELEAREDAPVAEPIVGDGFRIEEAPEDNRIRFYFDVRPDRETTARMKREGFRWSRREGAWQRHLNTNGRNAALRVARDLFGWGMA